MYLKVCLCVRVSLYVCVNVWAWRTCLVNNTFNMSLKFTATGLKKYANYNNNNDTNGISIEFYDKRLWMVQKETQRTRARPRERRRSGTAQGECRQRRHYEFIEVQGSVNSLQRPWKASDLLIYAALTFLTKCQMFEGRQRRWRRQWRQRVTTAMAAVGWI